MALESGQIAAELIGRYLPQLRQADRCESPAFERLAVDYQSEYSRAFNSRLRFSGLLRRAAFVPLLAETAMLLFGTSARLRRRLARATRPRHLLARTAGVSGRAGRRRSQISWNSFVSQDRMRLPADLFWRSSARHCVGLPRSVLSWKQINACQIGAFGVKRRSIYLNAPGASPQVALNFRRPNRSPRHAVDRWETVCIKFC